MTISCSSDGPLLEPDAEPATAPTLLALDDGECRESQSQLSRQLNRHRVLHPSR